MRCRGAAHWRLLRLDVHVLLGLGRHMHILGHLVQLAELHLAHEAHARALEALRPLHVAAGGAAQLQAVAFGQLYDVGDRRGRRAVGVADADVQLHRVVLPADAAVAAHRLARDLHVDAAEAGQEGDGLGVAAEHLADGTAPRAHKLPLHLVLHLGRRGLHEGAEVRGLVAGHAQRVMVRGRLARPITVARLAAAILGLEDLGDAELAEVAQRGHDRPRAGLGGSRLRDVEVVVRLRVHVELVEAGRGARVRDAVARAHPAVLASEADRQDHLPLGRGEVRLWHDGQVDGRLQRALLGRAADDAAVQDLRHWRHLALVAAHPPALRRERGLAEGLRRLGLGQRVPHVRREMLALALVRQELVDAQACHGPAQHALQTEHVSHVRVRQVALALSIHGHWQQHVEAAPHDGDHAGVRRAHSAQHPRQRAMVLLTPDGDEHDGEGDLRADVQVRVVHALAGDWDPARQRSQVDHGVDREVEDEADGQPRTQVEAREVGRHGPVVGLDPIHHVLRHQVVGAKGADHQGPAKGLVGAHARDPRGHDVGVGEEHWAGHLLQGPLEGAVACQHQEHGHGHEPLHVGDGVDGLRGHARDAVGLVRVPRGGLQGHERVLRDQDREHRDIQQGRQAAIAHGGDQGLRVPHAAVRGAEADHLVKEHQEEAARQVPAVHGGDRGMVLLAQCNLRAEARAREGVAQGCACGRQRSPARRGRPPSADHHHGRAQ
mmetsp:Transcript_59750/g.153895  ORF Transcript_59750/g.153895 Transcript_59750/m.153895 type:complete len:720 (+) Transcript_59750:785-2944(+)